MPDTLTINERPSLAAALSSSVDKETALGYENDPANKDPANKPESGPASQPASKNDILPNDILPEAAPANTERRQAPDAETGPDAETERYDKIPRFQELRTKAQQAEAEAAQVRAELAVKNAALARFEKDNPLYEAAQEAGYETVGDYLAAWQEAQQQEAAEQRAAQTLQNKAMELQDKVDSGEISVEIANRLYQLEQTAMQQQRLTQTQTEQARQTTVNLNRQALNEVTAQIPGLAERKDLIGVLEKTLTNPSGGDTIRVVGREVKAYGDVREQAGYDRAVAEMKAKQAPPAALSAGEGYAPPGNPDPARKFSIREALAFQNR